VCEDALVLVEKARERDAIAGVGGVSLAFEGVSSGAVADDAEGGVRIETIHAPGTSTPSALSRVLAIHRLPLDEYFETPLDELGLLNDDRGPIRRDGHATDPPPGPIDVLDHRIEPLAERWFGAFESRHGFLEPIAMGLEAIGRPNQEHPLLERGESNAGLDNDRCSCLPVSATPVGGAHR
jgi:hypothetical protein